MQTANKINLARGIYLMVAYSEYVVVGPFASASSAEAHYSMMASRPNAESDLGHSVWNSKTMEAQMEDMSIGREWLFTPEQEIRNWNETHA